MNADQALGGRVVDAAKVQREPYESTSAGPNREDMHFNGSLDARGADTSSGVGRAVSATGMDEVHVLRPISLTSGVDLREPSSTAAASASVSAVQQVGYEDRYSASSVPRPAFYDTEFMAQLLHYLRFVSDFEELVAESIPVHRLNRYFEFTELMLDPDFAAARILDSKYIVFRASMPDLVKSYRYFSHVQLDMICVHHNLTRVNGLNIIAKRGALISHICNLGCGHSIYVFKALARARSYVERKFPLEGSMLQDSDAVPCRSSVAVTVGERMPRARSPLFSPPPSPSALLSIDAVTEKSFQYLEVPDDALKGSIIREWQTEMSTESLRFKVCAACAKETYACEIDTVDAALCKLHLLRNEALPRRMWPTDYNFEVYGRALLCPAGLSDVDRVSSIALCFECGSALRAGRMPRFALANWLYYGREALPVEVKKAFDESTLFERMLVCRVRYNSVSCRFKASAYDPTKEEDAKTSLLRSYRKGVRGNVMVTPLDTMRLNDVLPPPPEVIRDTMSVIFIGLVAPSRQTIKRLRPVLVRKSRVKTMLQFLIDNNPHYGHLNGFGGFSEENFNKLFDSTDEGNDEGFPCAVHIGHLLPNDAVNSATADYTRRNLDDDPSSFNEDILMENVGFTVSDESPQSFRDMKLMAVQRCLAGYPFLSSRRGSRFVPDFNNPYLLSMAFPEEDPWGIGGMLHPFRKIKITPAEQVSHLVTVHGGRFQRHSEFAFFYYNVLRKQLVSTNMRYKSPKDDYQHMIDKMLNIDLEKLNSLKEKCKQNPLYLPTDDIEKEIMVVMSSVGLVARHIPGSAGHKVKLRNEIRGVINYRGAPTLFLTINPSDVDNPIVRLLTGEDIVLEDVSRGEDMNSWSRRILAARNPAPCALFFDLMIRKFIRIILRYGRPGRGLFGVCTSYYVMVEAQGKGSLHGHMLIWLHGHLSPQSLRDTLAKSDIFQSKMIAWLENSIRSEMMDERLNTPRAVARGPDRVVGDPHPGTIPAPLLWEVNDRFWVEYRSFVDNLLIEYNWHEHLDTCWKYLKRREPRVSQNCRMGMTGETRSRTVVDPELFAISLRRLHPWIANYNDVIVFLLQCNMDIKFIGSGEAAKAFLYYVTDYITKPPLQVHAGLAALAHAISVANVKFPELGEHEIVTSATYIGAMTSTVNSMMGHQEISHPQVMSYLIGGGDHYTPEQFATLYWGAVKRYVDRSFGAVAEDDAEIDRNVAADDPDCEVELRLSLGVGTISASSQLMDYIFRCLSEQFTDLSLYEFISRVGKRSRRVREGPRTHATVDIWPGQFSNPKHPQFDTHIQVLKKTRLIPVVIGPKFHRSDRTPEEKELWAKGYLDPVQAVA